MRNSHTDPEQLGLDLTANPHVPVATAEQVKVLLTALESGAGVSAADLDEAQGWITAEQLAAWLNWSDRKVRAVARVAVPGVLSYPGSPGYKLWGKCGIEEINAAIDSFRAQARDMTARAMLYESAYHSRYRGTAP